MNVIANVALIISPIHSISKTSFTIRTIYLFLSHLVYYYIGYRDLPSNHHHHHHHQTSNIITKTFTSNKFTLDWLLKNLISNTLNYQTIMTGVLPPNTMGLPIFLENAFVQIFHLLGAKISSNGHGTEISIKTSAKSSFPPDHQAVLSGFMPANKPFNFNISLKAVLKDEKWLWTAHITGHTTGAEKVQILASEIKGTYQEGTYQVLKVYQF